MKKFICLCLTVLFIVSSTAIMPLISNAQNDNTLFGYYTGGSGAPCMGTLETKNMNLNGDVNNYPGMSSVVNKAAPQKLASDGTFHYAHSAEKISPNSAPRLSPFSVNPIPSGNSDGYEYLIYDFDVLFATDTSSVAITVKGDTSGCNLYSALIAAKTDASNVLLNEYGTLNDVPYGTAIYNTMGTNEWHRIRIAFPINGQTAGNAITTIYVDGVKKVEQKVRSAQYNVDKSAYLGMSSSNVNGFSFLNASGNTNDVYLDNIKIFGGDNLTEEYTYPTISSVQNAEFTQDSITLKAQTKVSALKSAVVLSENAAISGVYSSDLASTKSDSSYVEDGDILVIRALDDYAKMYNTLKSASLNSAGTFKYIKINANGVDVPGEVEPGDADTLFGYYTGGSAASCMADLKGKNMSLNGDVNGYSGMSSVYNKQAPQKLMSDGAFHYAHSSEKVSPTSAPRIFPFNGVNPVPNGNSTYDYLIYDFDVLFATDTSNVSICVRGDTANVATYGALITANSQTPDLLFNEYGTLNDVPYGTAVYSNLGKNKWHRVRVAFPVKGQVAGEAYTYIDIDGVRKVEKKVRSAQYNVDKAAYSGINSSTINGFIFLNTAESTNDVYLDNIKIFGGSNNPEKYTQPSITSIQGVDIGNNDITIHSPTKVGTLKSTAILPENISIAGVYSTDLTTVKGDTAYIENGDILVIRAQDDYAIKYNTDNNAKLNSAGIYKYLNVNVEIPVLEITSLGMTPDIDNKNIEVACGYNNTFSTDEDIAVIVALYDNSGKLIEANYKNITIYTGEDTLINNFAISEKAALNAYKVKTFAVKSLTSLAPLCKDVEEILG